MRNFTLIGLRNCQNHLPQAKSVLFLPLAVNRKEDKELVFTTQYLKFYASYIKDGSVADTNELKTGLVLKGDKINSVSFLYIDCIIDLIQLKNEILPI